MNTIDRAALLEASAAVLEDSYARWCDRVEAEQVVPETEHEAMAEAVLPVIARELLAPLRELHADHECGNYDQAFWCFAPYRDGRCVKVGICSHCGDKAPCPTVRLLDQIESDVKGGER